jgi:hypothetical protein
MAPYRNASTQNETQNKPILLVIDARSEPANYDGAGVWRPFRGYMHPLVRNRMLKYSEKTAETLLEQCPGK